MDYASVNLKELLRYPEKGDVVVPSPSPLFAYGVNPADACASGYRKAARIVVENIRGRGDETFLFYPVVFLYRHHVELMLKSLILAFDHPAVRSITGAEPLTETEHKTLRRGKAAHSLQWLWDRLRPAVKALGEASIDAERVAGINSYIRQLSEIDPDSTQFRYTTAIDETKDRLIKCLEPGTDVDLPAFAQAMERLANYLEGLDGYVGAIVEVHNDMLTEVDDPSY